MAEQNYCGCCGNPCGADREWCSRCTTSTKHLGPRHLYAWERTYFATHGEPCPFQASDHGGTDG